jgi:tetratricopeptide (TPR) repeat protein
MDKLTLDDVRSVLPDLDELRPFFDHLVASSEPDRSKTWSGSGELGTVGSRLVTEDLQKDAQRLAVAVGEHLAKLFGAVSEALGALMAGDPAGAARAFLSAASLEEGRERPDRAQAYAAAAYRVARDERDQRPAALALRRWARATRSLGQLGDAQDRYAEAYRVADAMSDHRGAAEAAVGAGNVLEDQGRWSEAEEWYGIALSALDEIGVPTPERWHALLNLHIASRSRGAVEESVSWLERAEAVAAELGADDAAPFVENARGQLRMAESSFEEAEEHLHDALAAANGARARVTIRLNLAEALLAQRRMLDAAEHAREAELDAIRAGLVTKLPEVYRLLGRIASLAGNPDAFVLFERALDLIRDRALPSVEEALTLQAYAAAEERRGEGEAARELRGRAEQLFDELGITGMRSTWADVFGVEQNAPRDLAKDDRGS